MQKLAKFGLYAIGGLFALGILLQLAGYEPEAQETAEVAVADPAPAVAKEWPAYEFSGTGPYESDTLELPEKFTLRYAMEADSGSGIFVAWIHSEDGKPQKLAVNTNKPGTGETIVRGRGRRYLKVNAANCRWAIEIQP